MRSSWKYVAVAVGVAVIGVLAVRFLSGAKQDARRADSPETRPQRARGPARVAKTSAGVPEMRLRWDDDPAGNLRLEGQVVDAHEQPVEGVTVVIDSNPRRQVTSEGDGSFVFDKLMARTYKLEARKGDAVAGPVRVRVTATSDPIIMRLQGATSIEVSVAEAKTRRPIAGAAVELRSLAIIAATTGNDGVATVRGVAVGTFALKVSAPGYATVFRYVTSPGTQHTLRQRVLLSQGVAVSGTVVDASGRPVEGAQVVPETMSALFEGADPKLDAVPTDAKGRWAFTNLPRASVRFHAIHRKFAPGVSAPVQLRDGAGRKDVRIVVNIGGRIAGRVVDAEGVVVPYAAVHVASANTQRRDVRRITADQDGAFEVTGLPRRLMHLVAMSETASSPLIPIDLRTKPDRTDTELRLGRANAISGIVVDGNGETIAEARVVAVPELADSPTAGSEMRLRGFSSEVADAAGAFTFTALRPGRYRLTAIRPGESGELLRMQHGQLVTSPATDVRLVVGARTSIRGVVAFADGSHPELFSVAVGSSTARPFAVGDGSFSIDGVPVGTRFMRISGSGFVTKFVDKLDITAGADNDLGTITLLRGRTIRGRVTAPDGSPVGDAVVFAGRQIQADGRQIAPFRDAGGNTRRTVTAGDGSYELSGLSLFSMVVIADHESVGRSQVATVAAGADKISLDLKLLESGALAGKVTRNGEPVKRAVMMRPAQGANTLFYVNSGPDGVYRFDRLAPGKYVVAAFQPRGTKSGGGASASRSVLITSGKTEQVDIDERVGDIDMTLRIASADGSVKFGYGVLISIVVSNSPTVYTVSEARTLLAQSGNAATLREGMMAENQRIKFAGVAPGKYTACAAPIDGDPRNPEILHAFQTNTVDQLMYCVPATIAPSPRAQEITVTVKPVGAGRSGTTQNN